MTETTHEALVRQTGTAEELLDYFQGHRAALEADRVAHGQAVSAKIAEVDTQLHNHPIIRHSPNQYGHLDANGLLDGWAFNGGLNLTFTEVMTVASGTPFNDRPQAEKDVLAGMGLGSPSGGQYFSPAIKVLQLDWTGGVNGALSYLMLPGVLRLGGNKGATGSYARLLSGGVTGLFFKGITSDWGQCGVNITPRPGEYQNLHPYVTTETGSLQFFWAAAVVGSVDFDAPTPSWGYYLSPYGASPLEIVA